jgi:hypothetical protein
MEEVKKTGKVGRPKGEVDYFEDTATYQIRLRKATLKKFLDAFRREKARRKLTQKKGYFVNSVLTEMMKKYIEAVETKEKRWAETGSSTIGEETNEGTKE